MARDFPTLGEHGMCDAVNFFAFVRLLQTLPLRKLLNLYGRELFHADWHSACVLCMYMWLHVFFVH